MKNGKIRRIRDNIELGEWKRGGDIKKKSQWESGGKWLGIVGWRGGGMSPEAIPRNNIIQRILETPRFYISALYCSLRS